MGSGGRRNFIVPVDTKLATPYDIEQQTVKVADIFDYVAAHSRAQLIFLDACRNTRSRSTATGSATP